MDALQKQTRRFDTVSTSEAFPGWGSFPQLQWETVLAGAPSYHGNGIHLLQRSAHLSFQNKCRRFCLT